MRLVLVTFMTMFALLSAGCATKQAQTAEEFRQMIPQDSYGHHATIAVNRSFSQVIDGLKERADACLKTQVLMTTTDRYGQVLGRQTLSYTPTLDMEKARAELSVQLNIGGDGAIAGKVPEKGMFILVVVITPAGAKKTGLDIYRNSYYGADRIESSVKNWASGNNLECPKMGR